jgi:hypothetical protein
MVAKGVPVRGFAALHADISRDERIMERAGGDQPLGQARIVIDE